jgi:hypothetical protein
MATVTSPPSSPPSYLKSESPPSSIDDSNLRYARLLVERYAETELPTDNTSKILSAFLDHLPPDGIEAIVEDINKTYSLELRALADHYFSAILLPSMFL